MEYDENEIDPSRLIKKDEQLICFIYHVVFDPSECLYCGKLFCTTCIELWKQKWEQKESEPLCPKCKRTLEYKKIAGAMRKYYNDIDIKCRYCNSVIKLGDIKTHELSCGTQKCINFKICQKTSKRNLEEKFCSYKCLLFTRIMRCKYDYNKINYELNTFLEEFPPPKIIINNNNNNNNVINNKKDEDSDEEAIIIENLKWDEKATAKSIKIIKNGTELNYNNRDFIYRSALANKGFTKGIHYWEIALNNSDGQSNTIKIGISKSKNFDFHNMGFSDFAFGYAFYGNGQLRHNSNSLGSSYGRSIFGNEKIGVLLNMNDGTLRFCINQIDFGIAYLSDDLKEGPIYPAVALLFQYNLRLNQDVDLPSCYEEI